MLRRLVVLIICTIYFFPCILLSREPRWIYTFNGSQNMIDDAYGVIMDPGGNICAAGYSTESGASAEVRVISLNPAGDTNWTYRYGGSSTSNDRAHAITVGSDGNIYVAGRRSSNFLAVSIDTAGTQNWATPQYNGYADDVVYGNDDNLYLAGRSSATGSNFGVVSYTNTGSLRWEYWYNGLQNAEDHARALTYGIDGNIYAAGYSTDSNYVQNVLVISLTTSGDTNWTYHYSGNGVFDQRAEDIICGPDGNLYIAGYISDAVTHYDFTVISLDTLGAERWVFTYDASGWYDIAYALVYGDDGNIYAAGETATGIPVVISLTPDGDTNWIYTAAAGGVTCEATCIAYGADDNIYIGTADPLRVISITNEGEENWEYLFYNPNGCWCRDIVFSADSMIYAVGGTMNANTFTDIAVISLFTEMDPPSSPVLIVPPDHAYLNDTLVLFCWEAADDPGSGVKEYTMYYALDSLFSDADSIVLPDTTCTIALSDTTYYWKVQAADSAGNIGAWSEVWECEIDTTAPTSPVLISPPSGIWLSDTMIELEWTEVSFSDVLRAPVRYELQVDTVASFVAPIMTDTLMMTSAVCFFPDNWYYWHVKAFDLAGNESPYSPADSFGVDVTAPVIESTTVWNDTSFAGPFEIFAKVHDNTIGLDSVLLYYKLAYYPTWISRMMHYTGTSHWYLDTIPAVGNPYDTVFYYIRATDMLQNAATDPIGAPAESYSFVAYMTGIAENNTVPMQCACGLRSSPVRGEAVFDISLPAEARIELSVYDAVGRLVAVPVSGRRAAGFHDVHWTVESHAGIYFYIFESPWIRQVGKLVVLK